MVDKTTSPHSTENHSTHLEADFFTDLGVEEAEALSLAAKVNQWLQSNPADVAWQQFTAGPLKGQPYPVHLALFHHIYRDWDEHLKGPCPAWIPDDNTLKGANLHTLMTQVGTSTYSDLHQWSCEHFQTYWKTLITQLTIPFKTPFQTLCDLSEGPENPRWLPGATLNIVDSCFLADPTHTAILYQREGGSLIKITYGDLKKRVALIASALKAQGFVPGDSIAIDMPMNVDAVAIYLAIIAMGGAVVSIADSFSPREIASRLRITQAKGVFTQDVIHRGGKIHPLYEKVKKAKAPKTIVIPAGNTLNLALQEGDITWDSFLSAAQVPETHVETLACNPMDPINHLFSSGTTGDPKAIPWTHVTAIKSAADAYCHHNIHSEDILCWPTSLGWMMGPWLVFAALINQATLALYEGLPSSRDFGKFVEQAKVSMLGVVPTLVKTWRHSECMEGLDWSSIQLFSSTAECSNPEDMLYLMWLANYKPIIEYCGGTEIGGGYITSTVIQPNAPSTFSTFALGVRGVLLDEQGHLNEHQGEVALIGPSMGLSTQLLNRDHHEVYFEGMPQGPRGELLRRHGDELQYIGQGYYRALGRADDTMNLGGIKVSSAEIERTIAEANIEGLEETAAVAVTPPAGGPHHLVIYAVPEVPNTLSPETLKAPMQNALREHLNPLFKIHEVRMIDELPRTASNKVMRRKLRET